VIVGLVWQLRSSSLVCVLKVRARPFAVHTWYTSTYWSGIMGFLLLDYILYFAILASRFMREGRTESWPVVAANVSVDAALTDGVYSKVEIVYTYDFGGKHYPGSYDVLFLWGPLRGNSRNNSQGVLTCECA
jgi:hypothetical protein